MTSTELARTTTAGIRIRWIRVAGLLGVLSAIGAVLGHEKPASPTSTAISQARVRRVETHHGSPGQHTVAVVGTSEPRGPLGEADGAVPGGTTVFDDSVPGVARIDPELLGALRRAADAARIEDVEFVVDSGWRSRAYQAQLLQQAVSRYGPEEAARLVADPGRSSHVSGHAVDLAGGAAAWLAEHGTAYGLCQIYANEPWHYELRRRAVDHGCPPPYADPTHDPRMQP